jgi:protein TonB
MCAWYCLRMFQAYTAPAFLWVEGRRWLLAFTVACFFVVCSAFAAWWISRETSFVVIPAASAPKPSVKVVFSKPVPRVMVPQVDMPFVKKTVHVKARSLYTPKQTSQAPLQEAQPVAGVPDNVSGVENTGDIGKNSPEAPSSVAVQAPKQEPVQLPENAVPPEPFSNNAMPAYPESARHLGQSGQVVLKIVVSQNGSVENIQILKGEEPFIASAVQAVQTWRYTPALIDGVASSVYRIVKIPFQLRE